jgi:hypothetical protein
MCSLLLKLGYGVCPETGDERRGQEKIPVFRKYTGSLSLGRQGEDSSENTPQEISFHCTGSLYASKVFSIS